MSSHYIVQCRRGRQPGSERFAAVNQRTITPFREQKEIVNHVSRSLLTARIKNDRRLRSPHADWAIHVTV
jgi:hypothetical protein